MFVFDIVESSWGTYLKTERNQIDSFWYVRYAFNNIRNCAKFSHSHYTIRYWLIMSSYNNLCISFWRNSSCKFKIWFVVRPDGVWDYGITTTSIENGDLFLQSGKIKILNFSHMIVICKLLFCKMYTDRDTRKVPFKCQV